MGVRGIQVFFQEVDFFKIIRPKYGR